MATSWHRSPQNSSPCLPCRVSPVLILLASVSVLTVIKAVKHAEPPPYCTLLCSSLFSVLCLIRKRLKQRQCYRERPSQTAGDQCDVKTSLLAGIWLEQNPIDRQSLEALLAALPGQARGLRSLGLDVRQVRNTHTCLCCSHQKCLSN